MLIEGEVTGVRDEPRRRILTYDGAAVEDAYVLADWWAVRPASESRTATDRLEEVARSRALAERLTERLPVTIHQAIAAGATPVQVATAYGADVDVVHQVWNTWAAGRRRLAVMSPPGTVHVDLAEFERVSETFERAVGRW